MATTMAGERHRHALPHGYQLQRYQIQDQLGFGSFGITYLARDTMLSRMVAIKELLPTMIASRLDTIQVDANSSSDRTQWNWAQQRFLEEAQTLAACEHLNILQVYETFRENGTAYMVTRYEEGCNFKEWLKRLGRQPTEAELEGFLLPILDALTTVHRHGFLHRDIKPENIYIARDGRPILIDFGSARQEVASRSVPMTAIVTEGYAPFEQYVSEGEQGPWTDLYSLAAVMYTAITGKVPPFATVRHGSGTGDPCLRLATTYGSRYRAHFLQSIDAALRVAQRARPQSAAEWVKILTAGAPIPKEQPYADSHTFPPAQTPRPNQAAYWFLSAALVNIGTLAAVLILKSIEPKPAPIPANRLQALEEEIERVKANTREPAKLDTAEKDRLEEALREQARLKEELAKAERARADMTKAQQERLEQVRMAQAAEEARLKAELARAEQEKKTLADKAQRDADLAKPQPMPEVQVKLAPPRTFYYPINPPPVEPPKPAPPPPAPSPPSVEDQIRAFIISHLQHENNYAGDGSGMDAILGDYSEAVFPYPEDPQKKFYHSGIEKDKRDYLSKQRGSEQLVEGSLGITKVGNLWKAVFETEAIRHGGGNTRRMRVNNEYHIKVESGYWKISGQKVVGKPRLL